MLETYSPQEPVFYEDAGQSFDLSQIIGVVKRRILYFAIPFLIVAMLGYAIIKTMPSIYQAEGVLLVESPNIARDLVQPTITEIVDERFEVFKQLILSSDHLISVANKFDLFPSKRQSISEFELLDLMRKRVVMKPVPLEMQPNRPTIAFSVGFDYEIPDVSLKVADEFVTAILNEDARSRTHAATETAGILEDEVKRLKDQHDEVVAKLAMLKQPDQQQAVEQDKTQIRSLADLELELAQKSAVYSSEHPVIKNLKMQIAALKRAKKGEPQAASATGQAASVSDRSDKVDVATLVLQQQQLSLERRIDDANRKLSTARLGESLVKNQEGEHLKVIRYPELPITSIRPKKLQLAGIALGVAGLIGAGLAFAAELLDGTLRRSQDLAGIVDKHLIVTIPYMSSPEEEQRKRRNIIFLYLALAAVLAAAIVGVLIKVFSIDFAWFDRAWLDALSHLSH